MQLIYRGSTYNYTPQATRSYHKPQAANWRYQTSDVTYSDFVTVPRYRQSHAVNWRYQVVAEV